MIEHVYRAKACVVDLTGRNANVYYEMAVRHTARLPVVLIIEEEELDDLPFDIQQMRVIPFCHTDLASAAKAKDEIIAQMREALEGEVDSPIGTVLNLQNLQQGNSVERTLAELVTLVDALATNTSSLSREVRLGRREATLEKDEENKGPGQVEVINRVQDALADLGVTTKVDVAPGHVIFEMSRGDKTRTTVVNPSVLRLRNLAILAGALESQLEDTPGEGTLPDDPA